MCILVLTERNTWRLGSSLIIKTIESGHTKKPKFLRFNNKNYCNVEPALEYYLAILLKNNKKSR